MSSMSNDHLKLVPAAGEPPRDPLLGQVLDGRYQVEKVLGEGGMGIVYKARHVTLGKALAIKVLRAEVSKDQEIVQRFRQEAQSATAIGNHHIIDISDFGALPDGSTYFVMEFLDGIPLTSAIEAGKPLRATRTIHIAKQLCRALGAAHDIGIVHRDLKPDNIYLISRGGDADFVKVLDFGIAKVGGAKSKLTQAGQVFGTPHYMSPEQCSGTTVDKRTDVYALGVIMYEMASSRVPFDADNLMGILTKHLYEEPVRPHELPPPVDVPSGLEAVIMKSLAKKADARYQSMQEVLADLERVEQGLTPGAVVEGVRRATQGSGPKTDPMERASALTVDVGDVSIPKKSSGLLIAAAVLLLGGAGSYLVFGGGETEASQDGASGAGLSPEPSSVPPPVAAVGDEEPAPEVKEPAVPVPPPVVVTLSTTPEQVEVYSEGALIGHTGTPSFTVPRPRRGEPSVSLVLKSDGYEDLPVRITSFTQERLAVALEKTRRRAARRTPSSAATREPEKKPEPTPPKVIEEAPKSAPPLRRPASEVLNPWE
jgi:serine/threonine-protein kinase